MNKPPSDSTTSKNGLRSARLYLLPRAPLNSGSLFSPPECSQETWLESMPPSSACSQLHSCQRLEVKVCRRHPANSHSGGPGWCSGSPMYVHRTSPTLTSGIAPQLDLPAEAALPLVRLGRDLDALAVHVVLPAVVGAPQPGLLVAAEPQRHAPVRAELVHQAVSPLGVPEGDQPFGQQLDADRRAVVLGQFRGEQRGNPVLAEQSPIGVPGPVWVSSSLISCFSIAVLSSLSSGFPCHPASLSSEALRAVGLVQESLRPMNKQVKKARQATSTSLNPAAAKACR